MFLRAARWTIAIGGFFVVFFLVALASTLFGFPGIMDSEPISVLLGIFAIAGAAAGATIFLGMFAYLLTCHESSPKGLWVLVFLLTGWYGAAFYFFKVYQKQVNQPRHDATD